MNNEIIEHNFGIVRYSSTHFYFLESSCFERRNRENEMNFVTKLMGRLGLLKEDLDYHFVRASMGIIYFFFGYQKWFDFEAQAFIPFFTHGPLVFCVYPVFGLNVAS